MQTREEPSERNLDIQRESATVKSAIAKSATSELDNFPVSGVQSADLPLLGMHCSACAVRIEKALNRAPGVATANVNFATTRATVSSNPALTDLPTLCAGPTGAALISAPGKHRLHRTSHFRRFWNLENAASRPGSAG
ncbi:Heavy-metal-associated domain-containing protein [Abditibacterium utsteinense]|uniref:Heavy-metal-associated domain-containing protein n=1 Tax=Abditibacterium utsteinense TaxID=1960156 RepID=A0A2S8SS26_9BACT|nr:Heavy-metal-associated domain-containing protein [Abditibacterium utsteinense]